MGFAVKPAVVARALLVLPQMHSALQSAKEDNLLDFNPLKCGYSRFGFESNYEALIF